MKFVIVGRQASGKLEVLNLLESEHGMSVGREFMNCDSLPIGVYGDPKYEHYSIEDINQTFNTQSYLCIGNVEENQVIDGYSMWRGISHYTYDNSDAFVLSPMQVMNMNMPVIKDRIIWVWLDNPQSSRIHRHVSEKRTYNFAEIEQLESRADAEFTKFIYEFPNSNVIYFHDEVPERVATIIATLHQYPDLIPTYVKNFN